MLMQAGVSVDNGRFQIGSLTSHEAAKASRLSAGFSVDVLSAALTGAAGLRSALANANGVLDACRRDPRTARGEYLNCDSYIADSVNCEVQACPERVGERVRVRADESA